MKHITLSAEQQAELERLRCELTDPGEARRAEVLRLSHAGNSVSAIARSVRCSTTTVRELLDRFEIEGLAAVRFKRRSGSPLPSHTLISRSSSNSGCPALPADRSQGQSFLDRRLSRRGVGKAVGSFFGGVVIATVGSVFGNLPTISINRQDQRDRLDGDFRDKEQTFFEHMSFDRFGDAVDVAKLLTEQIRPGSSLGRGSQTEYLRWLNNQAQAEILRGDYATAQNIYTWALRKLGEWPSIAGTPQSLLIQTGAAWVFYHLDDRVGISRVRSAVSQAVMLWSHDAPVISGWCQPWCRLGFDNPAISPLGVEGRLLAMEGEYQGAWDALAGDAKVQGPRAAGSLHLLGEIGIVLNKPEQEIRHVLNQIESRYVPPSSWGHMKSGRDMMLWWLGRGFGSTGPNEEDFVRKAEGPKAAYYAKSMRIDTHYILPPHLPASFASRDSVMRLRREWMERAISGFEAKQLGHLYDVVSMKNELAKSA